MLLPQDVRTFEHGLYAGQSRLAVAARDARLP